MTPMQRIPISLLLFALACAHVRAQPLVLSEGTTASGGTLSHGGTLVLTGSLDLGDIGRMTGGSLVLSGGAEIHSGTGAVINELEPVWVLRSSTGPSPRSGHALAYDASRHVTVLFGGWRTNGQGTLETLGDLWEWDGSDWTLRVPHNSTSGWVYDFQLGWRPSYAGLPVPRSQHSLAFDKARGRIVLFGGQSFDPDSRQLILKDTWEWDGVAWHFRANTGPAPRANPAMAYDHDRGVTVMTGGFLNGPDPVPGPVWEWDGAEWSMHAVTNGPSTSYSQDVGAMAYDAARRVTVFGPTVGDISSRWSFWEWNGTTWRRAADAYVPELWGLQYGDLTYDENRRQVLWFGGTPLSNTTAFFDGQHWILHTNSVVRPSPRAHLALAYDLARHAVVLFGGETAGPIYNGETWEFIASAAPFITEQPTDQKLNSGESALFHVGAVSQDGALLEYQWYRDDNALTDGARISGAQTDTLRISNVVLADTGHLHVRIGSQSGAITSRSVVLSLKFNLEVRVTRNEFSLEWTAAAATLEQADRPEGPWAPVLGATSPFRPQMLESARFYRLRP